MVLKETKKGFTLVETIVVLVVLAILAAILIPAMVKWIDKANQRAGIVECRQVVVAAQTIASEAYGTANVTLAAGSMMNAPYFEQVKALAQVPGTIVAITLRPGDAQVIHVAYITSRNVLIVYELDSGYTVSTVASNTLPGLQAAAGGLLQDLMTDTSFAGAGQVQQNSALHAAFAAAYGGTLPGMSQDVTDRLKAVGRSQANIDNLNWRPMLSDTGEVFYVASSSAADKSNPSNVAAVYYNNQMYYWWNGYSANGGTYVSNQNYNITEKLLNNIGSSTPTLADKDMWIALP